MKQFFSYSLLIAAFVVHIVMIKTRVPANDICRQTNLFADAHRAGASPEKSCFFLTPDAPFALAGGVNHLSNPRTPVSFIKTVHNPCNTLETCFSSLTSRQIHILRDLFFSHYSKKEKDGYYIYALRKLLI